MPNNIESESPVTQEKVSKKISPLKIIIPLFILLVLGVLLFIFKDSILSKFFSKYATENGVNTAVYPTEQEGDSTFNSLLDDKSLYSIDFENLETEFKENLQSSFIQGYVLDWDKQKDAETTWVFGEVKYVDGYQIQILITQPELVGLVTSEYFCRKDKTVLLGNKNLEILGTHVDVPEVIKPGYFLYIERPNEDYSLLGESCILVKTD